MNEGLPVIPEAEPVAAEKRIWGPWATLGLGMVILFVFFAVTVFILLVMAAALALPQLATIADQGAGTGVGEFVYNIIKSILTTKLGLVTAVALIGGQIVGVALILAFIRVRRGKSIADYLGLKRIGWRTVLIILAGTAAYLGLAAGIAYLTNVQGDDSDLLVQLYNTSVWPVLLWLMVVVFGPIFEEQLVRGFLFEGFRRSRLGLWGAILLTSLIWTGLHVGYNVFALGEIFVFGIVLGFVKYRTGSLWSTTLMHACFNAVSLSVLAFSQG